MPTSRPRVAGTRAGQAGGKTPEALLELVGDAQNATLVAEPPPGRYRYELKYDGYRILAAKSGEQVRLLSRRKQDWTANFPDAADAVRRLAARELVLDGEVVAVDERGVPSFQRLQQRTGRISYVVFDVLWVDGQDLRAETLEVRRARLERVLGDGVPNIVLSSAAEGDVAGMLRAACGNGFEGLIGKRAGSAYRAGRTLDWIKLKCHLRQEFAIIGYQPYTGTRTSVGSLLLALWDGEGFVFTGKVGTGFDQRTRAALGKELEAHRVARAPARGVPRSAGLTHFTEPRLVAEVQFTEWTEGGNARHPSFIGLRPDKRPQDCVREGVPPPNAPSPAAATVKATVTAVSGPTIAGVRLSHADRVLDPVPLTKLELARYYESVAEWILPHLRGRPLTLLRWAEGKPTEKGGVYLRHRRAWGPDTLRRVRIAEQKKIGEYLVADDLPGVIGLVQMDILEIHTWNSTAEHLEQPDRVVFDLDPDAAVSWAEVVRAAKELCELLERIGLRSWPKTTGGKGLHVVVPLLPEHDFATCFEFARTIAAHFARADPERFTISMPKAQRRGKILIDYLRNNRGNTSVAAFSVRANTAATVSVPIGWNELSAKLRSDGFTVHNLARRLARLRVDPWAEYWSTRQRLPVNDARAR